MKIKTYIILLFSLFLLTGCSTMRGYFNSHGEKGSYNFIEITYAEAMNRKLNEEYSYQVEDENNSCTLKVFKNNNLVYTKIYECTGVLNITLGNNIIYMATFLNKSARGEFVVYYISLIDFQEAELYRQNSSNHFFYRDSQIIVTGLRTDIIVTSTTSILGLLEIISFEEDERVYYQSFPMNASASLEHFSCYNSLFYFVSGKVLYELSYESLNVISKENINVLYYYYDLGQLVLITGGNFGWDDISISRVTGEIEEHLFELKNNGFTIILTGQEYFFKKDIYVFIEGTRNFFHYDDETKRLYSCYNGDKNIYKKVQDGENLLFSDKKYYRLDLAKY